VGKNTTLSGQNIKSSKQVEIGTIYTFDTQKYDRSLSWFGSCTLICVFEVCLNCVLNVLHFIPIVFIL